ncbi:transcription cofactor vestigial-like protein 1 isoform X2 [Colius striatus]|uniref:transcription cofactor vestigial-like protein 1 isoform X2 n=1 Tax=Colius striatus TaxID=57412 RepID=UPI002B1D6209|nr:transcription cofactor vestigial-like protein 1 isoform X2 [Colius striatus]
MEETRKLSPKLCKSKEPVKTEWGSQSVVFTYFQGDINSVVDEHFSRALSNVKNPQDLSTKHKGETAVLKNDNMSLHHWNFSSHCSKPYPSSSATGTSNAGLSFSAAGMAGQYQPSALRSHPTQPADLWPFPSIGTPSLPSSVYHHALPDLHVVDEPDRKYGSLLGLLQQERCLTSMQECNMKQHSSSACMTGPARLQNISQSSAPGGERKGSSYQGSENPSVSHATAGIQMPDRRQDLYF